MLILNTNNGSENELAQGPVCKTCPVECGVSGSRGVYLDPGFDLYTERDSGTPDFLKAYGS